MMLLMMVDVDVVVAVVEFFVPSVNRFDCHFLQGKSKNSSNWCPNRTLNKTIEKTNTKSSKRYELRSKSTAKAQEITPEST
eukprot:m.131457 g.131457  ORF g.131457 m.131457 type:complete len:81 (+) comp29549_c0_seq1:1085-1327(+)